MWVVISIGFGMADERVTRVANRMVADVANSRLLWACWPLVVGLGIGGAVRGAVTGAICTPAALAGFYLVHGDSLSNALGGINEIQLEIVLFGTFAGFIGGAMRTRLGSERPLM